MPSHFEWQSRLKVAVTGYLERRSFPRLILSAVLLLTGLSGFGLSFAMLHLGVNHMWIRYPVAVLGGYCVLLALIRLWVALEQSRFDPDEVVAAAEDAARPPVPTHAIPTRSSWFDWLDIPDFGALEIGLDEGCFGAVIFLIAAAILLAVIFAVASLLAMAPGLVMDAFLDAFIVTALYRRLRAAQKEHWLGTALRRTWAPALLTAAALAIVGCALEQMAPGAQSIGKAIQQIQAGGK